MFANFIPRFHNCWRWSYRWITAAGRRRLKTSKWGLKQQKKKIFSWTQKGWSVYWICQMIAVLQIGCRLHKRITAANIRRCQPSPRSRKAFKTVEVGAIFVNAGRIKGLVGRGSVERLRVELGTTGSQAWLSNHYINASVSVLGTIRQHNRFYNYHNSLVFFLSEAHDGIGAEHHSLRNIHR